MVCKEIVCTVNGCRTNKKRRGFIPPRGGTGETSPGCGKPRSRSKISPLTIKGGSESDRERRNEPKQPPAGMQPPVGVKTRFAGAMGSGGRRERPRRAVSPQSRTVLSPVIWQIFLFFTLQFYLSFIILNGRNHLFIKEIYHGSICHPVSSMPE